MALKYQPHLVNPIVFRSSGSATLKPNSCAATSVSSTTIHVSVSEPEPEPVFASVKTFAPATVANLGPGFDFLGCAVDGLGDYVSLTVDSTVHPARSPSHKSPATPPPPSSAASL
ncbi:homoserine kinase-like [Fagus crenata]